MIAADMANDVSRGGEQGGARPSVLSADPDTIASFPRIFQVYGRRPR